MHTSRRTKLKSTALLIAAAIVLELTSVVQYLFQRQGTNRQITSLAQQDLSDVSRTARLKHDVEAAIDSLLPVVEWYVQADDEAGVLRSVHETILQHQELVGIEYCHRVGIDGARKGTFIYRDNSRQVQEQRIDFDYTKRSWYTEPLLRDSFWTEPYRGKYAEVLMSTFSRPVRDASGEVVAVLGADIAMQELSSLASRLYEDQSSSVPYIIGLHLLGLLVLAFILQRGIGSINRLQSAEMENFRIAGELDVAQRIQQTMLPKTFPPYPQRDDIDIFASLVSAREVGGDFYDFMLRDEKLFFCIGDVSGKGVPAALVMAMAQSVFRMLVARESAPERIVEQMNDAMSRDNAYNMFITLFMGVLDLPTGRLCYTNAGHVAPSLIDASGNRALPVDSNLPIGAMGEWKFTKQEVVLHYGDTLFLYTDGLTEAENAAHEQFGGQRLSQFLRPLSPKDLASRVAEGIRSFVAGTEQSDDQTMMVIAYTRRNSASRYSRRLKLQNDVSQVPRLSAFVGEACSVAKLDKTDATQVCLAMEEAVVNVMSYAYRPPLVGDIDVTAELNEERLKFTITDSGKPFDPTTVTEPDVTTSASDRAIGGLGIHIIRQYMDSISYDRIEGCNVLTLRKKLQTT